MKRVDVPKRPGLRYRVFLRLYQAVLWAMQPLIWRYFRRRAARDAAYGSHLEERRGEGVPFAPDLWVHAVSLGEMTSAEPLVGLALADGKRVLTTHATPAGRTRAETTFAREIAEGRMAVRTAPIDRVRFWRDFLALYRPRVGLVMEMEFWPGMIEAARLEGVPLVLANAQVPARSLERAVRQARFLGHPAAAAALVLAKSDMMVDRFRALGVERVRALGETRFDMPLPEAQLTAGAALKARLGGRRVLCLASVVAGEEEIYAEAVRAVLAEPVPPLVIWVPRAPEKFEGTARLLEEAGFAVHRRSDTLGQDMTPIGEISGDILVGDSLGEMAFYIAASDVVLVGGGFTPKGTHNVIEPLAQGKPVITGPDTRTIEFPAIEARAAGVLTTCQSPGALLPAIRAALGASSDGAKAFHAAHKGASERIYQAVRANLNGDR